MRRKFWIVLVGLLLILTFASMIYIGYLSIQKDYAVTIGFHLKSWLNQQTTYLETKTLSETITYHDHLIVENSIGNIYIIGEDTDEITVTAQLKVTSNDANRALSLLEQTSLLLQNQDFTSIMPIIPVHDNDEEVAMDLILVVPKQIIGSINTKLGDIEITGLIGELEAMTNLGKVEINDFTGNAMVNSDLGDIHINDSRFIAELRVYAGLGNVSILGELANKTIIELNHGDLTIQLPEDASFNITASHPMGKLYTELPLLGKRTDNEADGILGAPHPTNQLFINVELGSINIKYL